MTDPIAPGPTLTALINYWPQLTSDPLAVGNCAALDRAGATDAHIRIAWAVMLRAQPQDEFNYWRVVLTGQLTSQWPEVQAVLEGQVP